MTTPSIVKNNTLLMMDQKQYVAKTVHEWDLNILDKRTAFPTLGQAIKTGIKYTASFAASFFKLRCVKHCNIFKVSNKVKLIRIRVTIELNLCM